VEYSTCCYSGCGTNYYHDALPILAVLAIVVAYRCAWLTRHAPRQSLARVWMPWLAIPAAFLWFIDNGEIGYAALRSGPSAILLVVGQVVVGLALFACTIFTFVGPLKLLARFSPTMSVAHRFATAAGTCELLWRGFYQVTQGL
jgi:hypothetical protein